MTSKASTGKRLQIVSPRRKVAALLILTALSWLLLAVCGLVGCGFLTLGGLL